METLIVEASQRLQTCLFYQSLHVECETNFRFSPLFFSCVFSAVNHCLVMSHVFTKDDSNVPLKLLFSLLYVITRPAGGPLIICCATEGSKSSVAVQLNRHSSMDLPSKHQTDLLVTIFYLLLSSLRTLSSHLCF